MDTVEVERSGDGVVTVTICNPKQKNAITPGMWPKLDRAFREIAASTEDRVAILTGAEGDFCSGANLSVDADDRRRVTQVVAKQPSRPPLLYADLEHAHRRVSKRCEMPFVDV